MAIKVLHFVDSGGLYGAESVILNLSREMRAGEKYEPIIGCIVSQSSEQCDLHDKALEIGIQSKKLVIRNALVFFDLLLVALKLTRLGIQIIHSHGYKPSVYGYIITMITPTKITATCHLWFLQGEIPIKMRMMIRLELQLYKFFPVIVAVSEPIKETLVLQGVNSNKIKVVNNGIVLDDYMQVNEDIRELLKASMQIEKGQLCIINVGRLNPQKNQSAIIDAAAILSINDNKLKFLIVGDGELYNDLQQQVKDNNLQQIVHLLGFRTDVKQLLQLADIFILPSLDEGMPMALLEAVACRIPVIATPVGDIQNLIRNDYSGVLIKNSDATEIVNGINQILESEDSGRKFADNAIESLHKMYSSKVMYKSYTEIYNKYLLIN
jgi:glycosyltransferase involved in cell wall biosynthesis